MALWRREDGPASIVVVSLAGREDLLPDFAHPLGTGETTVGRHESCGIQIVDGLISRQHMKIRHEPARDDYLVSDLGSANGTQVNGQTISGEVPLKEGDRIEIGKSRLVFTRKKFKDHSSALQHFRRQGEHIKGTLVQPPGT